MSDLIYRHDAIKAIETSRFLIDAIEKVMLLPSAQPKRKKGEWIDNETSFADGVRQTCTCSVCGRRSVRPLGDFCRWCGADMRTKETDYDYERAVDQLEHDILYEPTFNQDDGSM